MTHEIINKVGKYEPSDVFWISEANLILPITENVPDEFIILFPTNTSIDNMVDIIDLSHRKHSNVIQVKGTMFIDILVGYTAPHLNIEDLCILTTKILPYINISKGIIAKNLHSYIENIGTQTYIWNQMAEKTEYSYYQFKKRKWPVSKRSNINWQQVAHKIGLVSRVYPGGNSVNNIINGKKDCIKQPEDDELDVDSDLDDDDSDLLKHINNKQVQSRRAEKLRKLRMESNYATYSIPDILSIEQSTGLDMKKAVSVYDTCINIGQKRLAILYTCRMLVSRKYYHLVIKNPAYMIRIKAFMKENLLIYRIIKYCMKYSFYMIHKEERLLGKRITTDNRSIMSEEEFRELPVFNSMPDDSPYCTEIFHDKDNVHLRHVLPSYLHGQRRFTSRDEFIRRLDIMSGNMLHKLDLKEYGAFVTGSCLVPCLATNPLEENFQDHDSKFEVFLENYYPSYSSIAVYRRKFETAKNNLIVLMDEAFYNSPDIKKTYSDIDCEDVFVSTVHDMKCKMQSRFTGDINEAVDKVVETFNAFLKIESTLSDIDIAVMSLNKEDYEVKVRGMLDKIRQNLPEGPEHHVYLFKQSLRTGFKFVLKGPGAKRPIDFFKIWVKPQVLLHRFHLNNVKFWWDGYTLRGLSSGVCAVLTGVNQWYKWFSNNKDPMSIVLKNMQRGFTTILNREETETLNNYIKEVDKYKHIGKLPIGKIDRTHKIFGHEGGIRYLYPHMLIVCESYDNGIKYWTDPSYNLKRLGCSLHTTSKGKIVQPKIHAFDAIIKDLLL